MAEKNQENIVEKVVLIVLDGFGLAPPDKGNPVKSVNMPFLSDLISNYKSGSLVAAGLVVGLEWGTYGNSEVGHSAIGTGRVVVQSLARINIEIKNGSFFENGAFLGVLEHAKKNNSKVHIIGCVSPGGIHSHEGHLIGLLDFFTKKEFNRAYVHMITDGEDSAPDEGFKSLSRIRGALDKSGAKIATVGGRNFAMDRVKNWELIKKAWEAMVHGKGENSENAEACIEDAYNKKIPDSEILPTVIDGGAKIEDGDGVIFFNFRNDRMKQIVASFVMPGFREFDRGQVPKDLLVATMTNYSDDFKVEVAYPPQTIPNTLGEILSNAGLSQLRVAESEKEAHVTNFFNGGKLGAYSGEDRKIATSKALLGKDYAKHPEMSLAENTENILAGLGKPYSLIAANFANSDMVAHTGNTLATEKALALVDKSLEKIIKSADLSKTAIIITADHGNCEELIDPGTGEPDTQHSTTNVPVVVVSEGLKGGSTKTLDNLFQENPLGSLIDVAPTVLHLLGIKQPGEMSGSKIV